MNSNLENELCLYLGELMYKHENEFDWIEKDELAEKINAVNTLLDIDKRERKWFEKITDKNFNLITKQ